MNSLTTITTPNPNPDTVEWPVSEDGFTHAVLFSGRIIGLFPGEDRARDFAGYRIAEVCGLPSAYVILDLKTGETQPAKAQATC